MKLNIIKPKQALNKAFLKVKPVRKEIETFKTNLIELLDRTNDTESEEFHKNLVADFLKKTYYDPDFYINTKGRQDLVIHNGSKAKDKVGVILETKKPTNKSEMISENSLNVKAFQELVLYYLRERITEKNLEVKFLIVTNINEWFIFNAADFEQHFAQNKSFVKQFQDFENGSLSGTKTEFFYKEIAAPAIDNISGELECTYFNIRDYEKALRNNDLKDDKKLVALFKLLSPQHVLKQPFTNDSNSLDKRFYAELLHIIGLTEEKDGSKKLIQRQAAGKRNRGSLLEDAIVQLDSLDKISRLEKPSQFGVTNEERLFNVGLELCITWVNRILFLKLLEAQLQAYHNGDSNYTFLNSDRIRNYDDLNTLFFQVLARKQEDRNEFVQKDFANVPYLNSSLFEPTELEHDCFSVTQLNNSATIPVYSSTVLKDNKGKRRSGEMNTLDYFFAFLNAYDFSGEGSEDIQEDNKTLINASVLGLIFEKINGYKDGSFFTPGFITMYMCRETIRKAVVQKFNERASRYNSPYVESLDDCSSQQTQGIESLDDRSSKQTQGIESLDDRSSKQTQGIESLDDRSIKENSNSVTGGKRSSSADSGAQRSESVYRDAPFSDLTDIYNAIGSRGQFSHAQANDLINSIKICDPAVGSGHFLVSSLNEIIAIKYELGILHDRQGKLLRDYDIHIENDELIITDYNGELFEYHPSNRESQRVQETLFHEKQTIIENCLFGVDINPNSVKICRLRLWIELLKNAYYILPTNSEAVGISPSGRGIKGEEIPQLQTLPNIDINIKCGNSLISRFDLDADLSKALRKSKWNIDGYRVAVQTYRQATNKEQKREMERLIADIKGDFRTEISQNSKEQRMYNKLSAELYEKFMTPKLLDAELNRSQKSKLKKEREKLEKKVNKLKEQLDEIKDNKIYENAFEWRFEFPEVLDDDGNYEGFDCIIGNPPYIDAKKLSDISKYLRQNYSIYYSSSDLSSYFYELSINILRNNGFMSFISTNKFFRTEYGKTLREYISKFKAHSIINFEQVPIFEEALVSSLIITLEKKPPEKDFYYAEFIKEKSPNTEFETDLIERQKIISNSVINSESWDFSNLNESRLMQKIYSDSSRVKEIKSIDIKRGVTTGYDPAFIINVDTKNRLNEYEIIKPLLKGAHIKRFNIIDSQIHLIFTRRGCKIEDYPLIEQHLKLFYDDLKPRTEKDIRGRKPGSYKWFEIQDNIAYFKNFDEPKIVWPLTAANWGFALDTEKHYLSSGGFIMLSDNLDLKYLLGILNSNLMKFVFSKIGVMTAGGAFTLKKATIDEFPIKVISYDNQKPIIVLVDQILTQKQSDPTADTTALEREIDALVYELYGLTEEEIGIVESNMKD